MPNGRDDSEIREPAPLEVSPEHWPLEISPEALERLRTAAVPEEFLDIAREFAAGARRTGPAAVPEASIPPSLEEAMTDNFLVADREGRDMEIGVIRSEDKEAEEWDFESGGFQGLKEEFTAPIEGIERQELLGETRLTADEFFTFTAMKLDLSETRDRTPGLLAVIGQPIGGLVTLTYGLFFSGGSEALAFLSSECGKRAEAVIPHAGPPRFIDSRKAKLKPPDRDKSLAKARANLKELLDQITRQIEELKKTIASLRVAIEDGSAPPNASDILKAYEEQLKSLEATRKKIKEDLAEKPKALTKEEQEQWDNIRSAGEVRIAHKVCLFWRDASYDLKGSRQLCCALKFIRVLPIAIIRINPKKRLYIPKDAGEERISEHEYKKLGDDEKKNWRLAEPYSVEAHEREHVKDYRKRLADFLKGYSFIGFAISNADRVNQDKFICQKLQAALTGFLDWYTYLDLLLYPHGISEPEAVKAQRDVLKAGQEAYLRAKQQEETDWDQEIQAMIDAEANEPKCSIAAKKDPQAPHCLKPDQTQLVEAFNKFLCESG